MCRKILSMAVVAASFAAGAAKLPYTYTYSTTPDSGHSDPGNAQLKNGIYYPASDKSVQFNGNVTVTADLAGECKLGRIDLYAFLRTGTGGFQTDAITVQTSSDNANWSEAGGSLTTLDGAPLVGLDALIAGSDKLSLCRFKLSTPVNCRYVRVTCQVASGYSRQLLSELEFFIAPTAWTGSAQNGLWNDAANWQGGVKPADGASVSFATGEEIDLGGSIVTPERIEVAAGTLRLTNGEVKPPEGTFSLDLSEGAKAIFDVPAGNDEAGVGLVMDGAGEAIFNNLVKFDGTGTIMTGCKVSQNLEYAAREHVPGAAASGVFPAYVTGGEGSYCQLTVGETAIKLTHLGCAAQDGWTEDLTLKLYDETAQKCTAAAIIGSKMPGFALNGYRYARISNPIVLEANHAYRIICSDSDRSAAAILTENGAVQRFGRMFIEGELVLKAPHVQTKGLVGSGKISVGRSASPVMLQILQSLNTSTYYRGTFAENGSAGLLGITMSGLSDVTQNFTAANTFGDMVFIQSGTLCIPSVAAIGASTPVIVGSENDSGNAWLKLSGAGTISNPFGFVRDDNYGTVERGFTIAKDIAVTVENTHVYAYDDAVDSKTSNGRFLFGIDAGSGTLTVNDVEVDYGGCGAYVNGTQNVTPTSVVRFNRLTAPKGVRRMIVLNRSCYKPSRVEFLDCGVLPVEYADYCGNSIDVRYENTTVYNKEMLRLSHTTSFNPKATAFDTDITLGAGSKFVTPSFYDLVQKVPTTNAVFHFEGGTIQPLKDSSAAFWALTNSIAPSRVGNGGLTVNQQGYENAHALDVGFLTSLASGADGENPVTIENGGVCTFKAPMSYHGPTTVKGSSLVFDLTEGRAHEAQATAILSEGTDLILDDGANFTFKATDSGSEQAFASVSNASASAATLNLAGDNASLRVGSLRGTGGFQKLGAGDLTIEVPSGSSGPLIDGKVVFAGGDLTISAKADEPTPESIADGSFEPRSDPLTAKNLPDGGQRYGASHAAWLKAQLPGWTFDASDNVGIACKGGYFGSNVAVGSHFGLLRKTSGKMHFSFNVPVASNVRLTYAYAPREATATLTFVAQFGIWLDDTLVNTSEARTASAYEYVTINLGALQPGTHKISIGGTGANTDGLIDDVKLGIAPLAGAVEFGDGASINLPAGSKLNLDFTGTGSLPRLIYDGHHIYDTISAETHPEFVTGTGSIICNPKGFIMLVK